MKAGRDLLKIFVIPLAIVTIVTAIWFTYEKGKAVLLERELSQRLDDYDKSTKLAESDEIRQLAGDYIKTISTKDALKKSMQDFISIEMKKFGLKYKNVSKPKSSPIGQNIQETRVRFDLMPTPLARIIRFLNHCMTERKDVINKEIILRKESKGKQWIATLVFATLEKK